MSKKQNKKFGISRRAGCPLWGTKKDAYNKKNYPPGMHGTRGYRKKSEYALQLLSKQKLRCYYGFIRESQFRNIFLTAKQKKGDTAENFVGLLESRLDAFVYRSKLSPTIFSARQSVSHKHIKVNNKTVNIPSYILKVGDTIEIKKDIKFSNINLTQDSREVPSYIRIDNDALATYINIPAVVDVPYPIDPEINHIIEYYSR